MCAVQFERDYQSGIDFDYYREPQFPELGPTMNNLVTMLVEGGVLDRAEMRSLIENGSVSPPVDLPAGSDSPPAERPREMFAYMRDREAPPAPVKPQPDPQSVAPTPSKPVSSTADQPKRSGGFETKPGRFEETHDELKMLGLEWSEEEQPTSQPVSSTPPVKGGAQPVPTLTTSPLPTPTAKSPRGQAGDGPASPRRGGLRRDDRHTVAPKTPRVPTGDQIAKNFESFVQGYKTFDPGDRSKVLDKAFDADKISKLEQLVAGDKKLKGLADKFLRALEKYRQSRPEGGEKAAKKGVLQASHAKRDGSVEARQRIRCADEIVRKARQEITVSPHPGRRRIVAGPGNDRLKALACRRRNARRCRDRHTSSASPGR